MAEFNMEQAQQVIEGGIGKAQEVINDPAAMENLLGEIAAKAKELPGQIGEGVLQFPLMVNMVKSYVTKEYTEISPKVVASVVAAFLYLVSGKDIIDDRVPIVGMVDDVAVIGLALKMCEPELKAFQAWKDGQAV